MLINFNWFKTGASCSFQSHPSALKVWYRGAHALSTGFLSLWSWSTKKSVLLAWLVTVSVSSWLRRLVYLKAWALYSVCWENPVTIGLCVAIQSAKAPGFLINEFQVTGHW